jgi:hypothetical protein
MRDEPMIRLWTWNLSTYYQTWLHVQNAFSIEREKEDLWNAMEKMLVSNKKLWNVQK